METKSLDGLMDRIIRKNGLIETLKSISRVSAVRSQRTEIPCLQKDWLAYSELLKKTASECKSIMLPIR